MIKIKAYVRMLFIWIACIGEAFAQEKVIVELPGSTPIGLVKIEPGSVVMGAKSGEGFRDFIFRGEEYQKKRTISYTFWIGETEVTFDQWDACIAASVCFPIDPEEDSFGSYTHDMGWGRGNRPVINVNWNDIQLFIKWLNLSTSQAGRWDLPTRAEWEYAYRGGTTSRHYSGDCVDDNENYAYMGQTDPVDWYNCQYIGRKEVHKTIPVKSRPTNHPWGLREMGGNVSELVRDCNLSWWQSKLVLSLLGSYDKDQVECTERSVKGGSFYFHPLYARASSLLGKMADSRDESTGFRVAYYPAIGN
ncbi:formylglycine-generating enzyme family protein [Gammaproteobacteria bacterium]|nr:formylglycine-generating enzyme family protein [Gammaproteobacteria bacterium]